MILNETVSISAIVILYEFIFLSLYYLKLLNKNTTSNLVSPIVLLNIFIIFVMFLTDCKIDFNIKLLIVIVKTLLLIAVLFIAKFTFKNILISFGLLIIYYIFSNINKVYSCNVKMKHLGVSLLSSLFIYSLLILSNKLCK